jgi:hypothetical protein
VHVPFENRAPMLSASAVLLLAALGLVACAGQPKVTSTWQDKVPRDQKFTRLLVVAVAADVNQRCAFEWALVSHVKSATVQALASCDAMGTKEPLSRESVERAVARLQADAVVAPHLVDSRWGAREGGSSDTRGDTYWKASDSGGTVAVYGAYGFGATATLESAPVVTTMRAEVHVATRVYETHGATLLYTIETTVKDFETRADGIASITGPIGDRLRHDGLIR